MLLRRPAVACGMAALLLLAPSLLLGTMQSQSAPQNLTWATQFSEQFRVGILYPRWMPDSFEGLGGPAFYFYPPLPFWLELAGEPLHFQCLVYFPSPVTRLAHPALGFGPCNAGLARGRDRTTERRAVGRARLSGGAVSSVRRPLHARRVRRIRRLTSLFRWSCWGSGARRTDSLGWSYSRCRMAAC